MSDCEVPTVDNESGCCFSHGYHNCAVSYCEPCEETIVWGRGFWAVIGQPNQKHDHQDGPPEHVLLFDGASSSALVSAPEAETSREISGESG